MKARNKIQKSAPLLMAISIIAMVLMAPTQVVYAAPGDIITTITTPVASPSCCGIGIAVDCQDPANLYYTHSFSDSLHMMDKAGVAIGVPIDTPHSD